jgi:hypothetical protein
MTTVMGAFAAVKGIEALKEKEIGVRSIQSFVKNTLPV